MSFRNKAKPINTVICLNKPMHKDYTTKPLMNAYFHKI